MKRLVFVALLFLSGCTLQNPFIKPDPVPASSIDSLWEARQQTLIELNEWGFKGRTAIVQGKEGWNVSINWSQFSAEDYEIKLSGPFAQGGAVMTGSAVGVSLLLDNGERYRADTAEALMNQVFGWHLPVSALHYWLRGIPYVGLPIDAQTLDEKVRLTALTQAGWEIEIKRYIPFEKWDMPAKVFMKHPELSVRIVIADWRRP
jgi:outer membrane lipoprotein LolB